MAIDYGSKEYKRYRELEKKKEELKYEFDRIKEKKENDFGVHKTMYSKRLLTIQVEYAEIEEELKKNPVTKEFNEIDKRERKRKFKQIKETYKKANGNKELKFVHFIDKITMRAPKWRKIKNYSTEQLDYLIKAKSGETYRGGLVNNMYVDKVKKEAERYVERYYSNLSFSEKQKLINSQIYDNFQMLLQNENKLNEQIENSKEGRSL